MKVVDDELFIHFILISTIIAASLQLTCCSATANRGILCHENEKQALLSLKNSSWKAEVDCCSWKGVVCNNITGHVVELNLYNSGLTGELDDHFLLSLTHLTRLDLSDNSFQGALPRAANITKLQYFNISLNDFNSTIPDWLYECNHLEHLDLFRNDFQGALPRAANITKLQYFDISFNHFNSTIPDWLYECKHLEHLDLNTNSFQGALPRAANITKLQYFDISSNYFNSTIPDWLYECKHLEHLDLSFNGFQGALPRAANITKLQYSNNSFSGNLHEILCVSNSNETFSQFYNLIVLNLERNLLSGEFPDCFMKYHKLEVLNLGNNNISGRIPESIGNLGGLEVLNLLNNRLSGQIPSSMQHCTMLWKIDLSNNQLIGKLPAWMGTKLPDLNFLILRSNKLAGTISSGICRLSNLRILDLSDNKFSGKIPKCMDNFTAMASSEWIIHQEYKISSILDLHESATVATKGTRLYYDTILSLVTNIDLSSNNFSGDIPKQLASLAELRSLNLSRNHLNGKIPDGMEGMKVLESLDLSNNLLSGNIPQGIAVLSSLSCLDLSYNNLSGEIPQGTQVLTFNASSFVGNKLCGPPLTSSCTDGETPTGSVRQGNGEDQDGKSEIEWMYVFVSLGYAVGLAMVCNVLIFKKSWRDAFFESVDNMWNKLLVNARKNRSRCG